MELYEFAPTRSIRVRWTLQELGVPFEAKTVDLIAGEHRRPEFLRINPAGKLPVLVDGDLVLTESVAIVLYLADKYPDKLFIPRDLRGRGRVYRWLLFAATDLEQPLWRIARHTNLYPEDRRIEADVVLAREEFQAVAPVAEVHLRDRAFLVDDTATVADFVMAYTLDWGNEVGLLEGFPALLTYMKRMYARPAAAPRIHEALASIQGSRAS